MTLLLNENQFEGGDLELMKRRKKQNLKQGHAIFVLRHFLNHRVAILDSWC